MTTESYDEFAARMHRRFPEMLNGKYGGFDIGPGWWPIVESLCAHIQNHITQTNGRRRLLIDSNPYNVTIPAEVPPVEVEQIKEKFGGLRFYHVGGDSMIDGMISMAEAWAAHTCEVCGQPGQARGGGWIKTLCDHHEGERQQRMKEYNL